MTQGITKLAPGTRAVVTADIAETWLGPVAAGTVVTIVDLGPDALGPGEDYAAELADGRAVSFAAAELSVAAEINDTRPLAIAVGNGAGCHECGRTSIGTVKVGRRKVAHCEFHAAIVEHTVRMQLGMVAYVDAREGGRNVLGG